jgi:hypothetical protein
MPACGPNRESSDLIWLASGSSFDLHDLGGLDRQSRPVGRGDHRLPHPRNALRENLPPAWIELGEDVVEQEQGWCGQQFRFRKQEGQHRKTLLALRPELAQITIAARDHNVVEVWADSRRPTLEIAREPLLQRFPRRRLGIVRKPR